MGSPAFVLSDITLVQNEQRKFAWTSPEGLPQNAVSINIYSDLISTTGDASLTKCRLHESKIKSE